MPSIGRDIIPSHLGVSTTPRYSDGGVYENVRLRLGEVQEVVQPNDPKSLSKKFVEYSVYVQHRSNNGSAVGKMYSHCTVMNPFGGLADQVQYTLRSDSTPSTKKKGSNGLGKGSKVLLLCINGEHHNAVIVGGLRDQNDASGFGGIESKDLGHYYYANFNGVSAYIDNDGQFLLTYNGKTGVDGKTDVDKGKRGTRMAFLKDGSWNINTRDPSDPDNKQEQFIFLDHENHESSQQAKKQWQLQVTDGPAKIVTKTGLKVGQATDHMLLGESFRKAQQQLNKTLKQLLQQAGTQLSSAVDPSSGAPLVSVQAAGAFLIAASQAIDAFEQSAGSMNSFLSQNNAAD